MNRHKFTDLLVDFITYKNVDLNKIKIYVEQEIFSSVLILFQKQCKQNNKRHLKDEQLIPKRSKVNDEDRNKDSGFDISEIEVGEWFGSKIKELKKLEETFDSKFKELNEFKEKS